MALLDALFGPRSQTAGQPSGLGRILAPEVALPLAAGLLGNQGNSQNLATGFALASPGLAQQKELQAQTAEKNKTLDFFRAQAPEYAQMVEAGMPVSEAWQTYTQRKFAKPEGPNIFNAGGGNLYDADKGEWLSAPGGGVDATAGLMPVWLRDEETGQPVLGQMRKDGTVVRSGMPDGTSAIGPYEKSFETGAGKAAGEVTGQAAGALPGAAMTAARVSQQVEDLKGDPGLDRVLGPIDSRTPNIFPDAVRAQSKIDQIRGGAFLEARQLLKGGGAITDYEGQKAEQAYARLNQAQSLQDFQAALDEFNYYVQQGLQKLQAQAGMGSPRQSGFGASVPQVDYKSKYGLD